MRRGVSVFSSRRQRKEWYDVVYEKVPYFCFSCGIIGHSEIECPTPTLRDEKGCLPYSEKLRAPEEKRTKSQGEWFGQGDSSSRKSSTSGARGSSDKKSAAKRGEDNGRESKNKLGVDDGGEVTSPAKDKKCKDVLLSPNNTARKLFTGDCKEATLSTKKRKSDKRWVTNGSEDEKDDEVNPMEVVRIDGPRGG